MPAQVQRKDVHLFFGRIWGRHVRVCSVAVRAVVARARAVATVVIMMMMMMTTALSVPAVVAVVFVVICFCVCVCVRVCGAARAREEGPAARSGDVAHVQDPDWSP